MDVLDIWVNLTTKESAENFLGQDENAHIPGYLGGDGSDGIGVTQMLAVMDELDVATGILMGALDRTGERSLEIADANPGRFLVAAGVTDPRPSRNVRRIRELAQHPRFSMVRIMPLTSQLPINDAKHYPVYQTCE